MEYHEYANLFPMMPDADLQRMADDIRENGLLETIITHDGKILDGRNRYQACIIAEVDHRFVQFSGNDPLAFVISHNLHRRHLNEAQRGMVGAKLAKLQHGDNQHRPIGLSSPPVTQSQAAEMLNIGVNTIKRSRQVMRTGIPELQDMQMSGDVSAVAAASVAKLPEEEQRKAVLGGVAGVKQAAKKTIQPTTKEELQEIKTLPRNTKIIECNGMAIYASAKAVMDRLHKDDEQFQQSLEAMINYCETRIASK